MTILFDIDGTLIDHDSAEAIAVETLRRKLGLSDDAESFRSRWSVALEHHYNRYLSHEITLQDQRRERLREVIGATLSDTVADQISVEYINAYIAACRLYSDVKPALENLFSFRMGIISNGARSQQESKLVRTGIAPYFETLTFSDECGVAKPNREIFHVACGAMRAEPSETLYIGDRLDIDAQAAIQAGLHGIWLARKEPISWSDQPTRISTLTALPAAIEKLQRI